MSAEKSARLKQYLEEYAGPFAAVVPFDISSDKLYPFDFTASNKELDPAILGNTKVFSQWVRQKLEKEDCRYGVGGYNEHRTIYARSNLFDMNEEPRRLHLGIDIWGPEGTPVFSPLAGKVHSFRFNDNFGDYGATIILEYQVGNLKFHALFGHLDLASIKDLEKGSEVIRGDKIAVFGGESENGHWPPHLHFQLIFDLGGYEGDYPGVCRYSEREVYLYNCPDPDIILKHTFGY